MQSWLITTGEYDSLQNHFVFVGDEEHVKQWVTQYNAAGAGKWITTADQRADYEEIELHNEQLPDPNTKL